jgi:hypothetical protein
LYIYSQYGCFQLPPLKFGKRKRGYPFFANKYNYLIQNNIVIIKLNFYGRIVDAVAAESLRKIHMFRKHFDYVKIEEYD